VTFKESLRALVAGWKIILAAGLVGTVLAGVLSWTTDPQYVSTARFFVAAEADSRNPEELFQRNQIAGQRLASYVELVSSDAVSTEVARILGDDNLAADLPDQVTATTIPNTVILDLQVTGDTPRAAQRAAEAYAEAVPTVISQLEEVGNQQAAQVSVTPIVNPKLGVPTKQKLPVQLAMGGLLGVVVGAGVVVIRAAIKRDSSASD
jgi:capsular polysaccharide biosynthesis protein